MTSNGRIPRGIEVLVKKASVDPAFRDTLFTKRAEAAAEIGLRLNPAESAMLSVIPEAQLISIIHNTKVSSQARPVFMGYVAAAMLAALGGLVGCGEGDDNRDVTDDNEYDVKYLEEADIGEASDGGSGTYKGVGPTGIRPDGDFTGIGDRTGTGHGGFTGIRPDSNFYTESNGNVKNAGKVTILSIGSSGPGVSDEKRSRMIIDNKIRPHLAGIENLFRSEMKKNTEIEGGKLVFRFTLLVDGTVENVETVSDGIGSHSLESGILSRIRSWRFPPASDEVTVILPIVFVVTE